MKKFLLIVLWGILLVPLTARTQAISRWEYWTDENYSARITQEVTAVPVFQFTDSLDLNSLLPGLHVFNMRFMDTARIWSSVKTTYFIVPQLSPGITSSDIKYCEYWFDGDYAGKTTLSFTPSAVIHLMENIDISTLSSGVHYLNLRFGDESGRWSGVTAQFFIKSPPPSSLFPNKLTRYRIWFDNDVSTMEVFDLQPGTSTVHWLENFETPFLTIGDHVVNYQFRDSLGSWSAAVSGTFYNSYCLPHTGRSIIGPAHVCKNLNGVSYQISKIKNASGYSWTVPEGATIVAGNNTETIVVSYAENAQSGLISVMANNSCGNGELISMPVTVHPLPEPVIAGDTVACSGVPVQLSTEGSIYSFSWTFSPGAQVVAGGGINDSTVTVLWNNTGNHWAEVQSMIMPGCASLVPGRTEVNTYPLPVPSVSGESWSYVNDTSVFFTESGKSDYVWVVPTGDSVVSGGTLTADSVVVLWRSEGEKSITVVYTDEHGCTAAAPASVSTWVIPCDTCYCSSGALIAWSEDITRVAFGTTLDNSTPCASLTGTQGTAGGTPDLYSDFTGLPPTLVRRNMNNPYQVEIAQCDGFGYSHDVRIYVDFNRNFSFFDPGEEFIIWPYYFSNSHTISGEIFIPADVPLGTTRMRVVCTESPENGPCLVQARGETEDYLVEIGPYCMPPDTLMAGQETNTSVVLDWSDTGIENSWEILYGPAGFDTATSGTLIPGIVSHPFLLTALSSNSQYVWYIRATCDDSTTAAWSAPSVFHTLCDTLETLPLTESFDNVIFPPDCWRASNMSRVETGTFPTCTPYSGPGMVRFESHSLAAGESGLIILPVTDFPGDTCMIRFRMYRDEGFPTKNDRINIWVSTTPSINMAQLLGSVSRAITKNPVVAMSGWYDYHFVFDQLVPYWKYFILEAVSEKGNNIFLDEISAELYEPGKLSGTITECYTQTPLSGVEVRLSGRSTVTNTSGQYIFTDVLPGSYELTALKPGYNDSLVSGLSVTTHQHVNLDLCLKKIMNPPGLLRGEVASFNVVELNWLGPVADTIFQDGFENYPDFALVFQPWITLDYDHQATADFGPPYTWPHINEPQAFQIFTPANTLPPATSHAQPHSGNKFAASWGREYTFGTTYPVPKNDWLISPQIQLSNDNMLIFYAKNYNMFLCEIIRVGISTTGTNIGNFSMISPELYLFGGAWKKYSFDLSTYQGQSVYIAIICLTEKSGGLLSVDDFGIYKATSITSGTGGSSPVVTGYNVYRGNQLIADSITSNSWYDTVPMTGTYSYSVTALYAQGESIHSDPVSFHLNTCLSPTHLSVADITTSEALLHWVPSNYTPNSNWVVEWGTSGFSPGTGTLVEVSNEPSLLLTGLSSWTEYDYYVYARCSNFNDTSYRTGPRSFRTSLVNCPENGIPENELCGSQTNMGCNNTPFSFMPVLPGQTICGTYAGSNYFYSDVDWYSFTLDDESDIAITGVTDFSLKVYLYAAPCPVSEAISSAQCLEGSSYYLAEHLPAGEYYIMVEDLWYTNCAKANQYTLTLMANDSCQMPSEVTASNLTASSAVIGINSGFTWFNITYNEFWWVSQTSPYSGITINNISNPYTLNGLQANTDYYYFVQAVCGPGDSSYWTGPYYFTTPCQEEYTIPYGPETFSSNNDFECMEKPYGILANPTVFNTSCCSWSLLTSTWYFPPSFGGRAPYTFNHGLPVWLITPLINPVYPHDCLLDFDLLITTNNPLLTAGEDKFIVLISTNGGLTWSSSNILREWNNTGSAFIFDSINKTGVEHIQVPFTCPGESFKIGFYFKSSSAPSGLRYELFVDNVGITAAVPVIPEYTTVSDTVASNQSQCFNATHTITVSNFTVEAPGGSAEFIAGQKVTLLPGTVVQQNAYMLARIAVNNEYCQAGDNLVAASASSSGVEKQSSGEPHFRIFPNPTSGKFTLRVDKATDTQSVIVQLYNIKGELFLSDSFTGKRDQEFNMSEIPDGLYFARVISGTTTEVLKLIIQR